MIFNSLRKRSALIELICAIIVGLLMMYAIAGCAQSQQVYRGSPPMIEPSSQPSDDASTDVERDKPFAARKFS